MNAYLSSKVLWEDWFSMIIGLFITPTIYAEDENEIPSLFETSIPINITLSDVID
jgi:hypothetical protein